MLVSLFSKIPSYVFGNRSKKRIDSKLLESRNKDMAEIQNTYNALLDSIVYFMNHIYEIDINYAVAYYYYLCKIEFLCTCSYNDLSKPGDFFMPKLFEGRFPCMDAFISKTNSVKFIVGLLCEISELHSDFEKYNLEADMHLLTDIKYRMSLIKSSISTMRNMTREGIYKFAQYQATIGNDGTVPEHKK